MILRAEFEGIQHIGQVIADACGLAKRIGACITFEFNGVHVKCYSTSEPDDVRLDYCRGLLAQGPPWSEGMEYEIQRLEENVATRKRLAREEVKIGERTLEYLRQVAMLPDVHRGGCTKEKECPCHSCEASRLLKVWDRKGKS